MPEPTLHEDFATFIEAFKARKRAADHAAKNRPPAPPPATLRGLHISALIVDDDEGERMPERERQFSRDCRDHMTRSY